MIILRWISSILASPINLLTSIVLKIRLRKYSPEKRPCPACGFRGDSGTYGKSCKVECIDTAGQERKALKHTCFVCGAEYASKTLQDPSKWALNAPKPSNGNGLPSIPQSVTIQPVVRSAVQ